MNARVPVDGHVPPSKLYGNHDPGLSAMAVPQKNGYSRQNRAAASLAAKSEWRPFAFSPLPRLRVGPLAGLDDRADSRRATLGT